MSRTVGKVSLESCALTERNAPTTATVKISYTFVQSSDWQVLGCRHIKLRWWGWGSRWCERLAKSTTVPTRSLTELEGVHSCQCHSVLHMKKGQNYRTVRKKERRLTCVLGEVFSEELIIYAAEWLNSTLLQHFNFIVRPTSCSLGGFIWRIACCIWVKVVYLLNSFILSRIGLKKSLRTRGSSDAPFTHREYADISLRFGLSFTRKPCFDHRKQLFLKNSSQSGDFWKRWLCVAMLTVRNRLSGSQTSHCAPENA